VLKLFMSVAFCAVCICGCKHALAQDHCLVADPTGTPLNVRTVPNGQIVDVLRNGFAVRIIKAASSGGKAWVYVVRADNNVPLGWVFRDFLTCEQRATIERIDGYAFEYRDEPSHTSSSLDDCASSCRAAANCTAYVFFKTRKICRLMTRSDAVLQPNPDAVSGYNRSPSGSSQPRLPQPAAPPSLPPPETPKSVGSGVVIGAHGEVLTNAHVVESCAKISVRSSSASTAYLVARDEKNDLAVVRSNLPLSSVVVFREGAVRPGDAVVALGYPLSGLLATTANLSVGNVSALAGLGDDSRYLQISAPVQFGNSGGPLLDTSGHLIGIVTGKLDAMRIFRFWGDVPQNVNFALKAEVARTFLDSKGIAYQTARTEQQLSPADVGEIARPFTVQIECEQAPDAALGPGQSGPSTAPATPPDVEKPRPDPPAPSLLGISLGRWAIGDQSNCEAPNKAFSLKWNGRKIVWQDGLGNVDTENVIYSDEHEFQTTTVNSIHKSGRNYPFGTSWIYSRDGLDGIQVTESGRRTFHLARCR
jgi:S1-C subfamily serine protease